MIDTKIKQLQSKYQELETELQNPDIFNDAQKAKAVSRQYNQIGHTLEQYKKLQSIQNAIAEAEKTIAEENDDELVRLAQDELVNMQKQANQLTSEINQAINPSDPMDAKDIIVEIRAGTGGDEAALFAADLFRMYQHYAEKQGWQTHLISSNRTGIGGLKEVIFEIIGTNVYSNLKYESGVHRVQRVPETEKSGRIHTSAATVAILPEAEEVDIQLKPEDLDIQSTTSSGHGGQSVNTTYSAIRIVHKPTGTMVICQDERSQKQNKEKALQVLRSRLLATKQEEQMKERASDRKNQIGTGDRSEKIRTYNFPQDRVTDHRIKKSFHNLEELLNGNIDPLLQALKAADKPA